MLATHASTSHHLPHVPVENLRSLYNDPYRRLGVMVILQALKDACSTGHIRDGHSQEGALYFLLEDDIDFPRWCIGLGLDPLVVRAKIRAIITKYQQHHLVEDSRHVV